MFREAEFQRLMKELVTYAVKQNWTGNDEDIKGILTPKVKRVLLFFILDTFAANIPKSLNDYTLSECKEYYERGRRRAIE